MADASFQPGWELIEERCRWIAAARRPARDMGAVRDVFGVPRGGCVPGAIVATLLELPLVEAPGPHTLLIDDLIDSGATAMRYAGVGAFFDALYRKPWSPSPIGLGQITVDAWVEFPWELAEAPGVDAVLRLLQRGGLDTSSTELHAAAHRLVEEIADIAVSLVSRRLTEHSVARPLV